MTLRAGRPATGADAAENTELRDRLVRELPAVRAAANQWRTALAAILTAVLAIGAFKGRDTAQGLAPTAAVWFGALLAACGLLAMVGILACSYAAYGLPIRRRRPAGGLLALDAAEARTARRLLLVGIGTALLGVAALAAAIAVSWYAPKADAAPSVVITRSSGEKVCGGLAAIDRQGVRVTVGDRDEVIPLAEIVSLTPQDRCGATVP